MTAAATVPAWDEKKHPRKATGRFDEKTFSAPDDAVTIRAVHSFEDAINEAYPVPQANNLELVGTTVAAVSSDVTTSSAMAAALGLDKRQGAYYLNAAGYLGLVEVESDGEYGAGIWRLTALGEEMSRMPEGDQAALLRQLAEATPAVAGYRENGLDGAANAISEAADLSDDTIERRAATAMSWAKSAAAPDFDMEITRMTETARERFALAAATAKTEREAIIAARAPKAPEVCGNCFTEMPASGVCGSFICL